MPRYARLVGANVFFHIFNRGIEKREIFRQTRDYTKFLDYLLIYQEKYDWIIYCYCLLPNHYHLLIQTKRHPLGVIMQSLQTAYGVYFNKKYQRVGHLFSGRYKSIICQKDEYLLQVSKYIHLNPVKAQLCHKPLDYPFSSYQEYLKGKNQLLNKPIIDKRAMRRLLGENISEKSITMYQSFVEEKKDRLAYDPERQSIEVFGNKRFSTKFKRLS